MEPVKAVIDQNVSINHEAMAVNAAGQTVSAKEVLCAELPAAILAIQAGQALTKNPWVSFILGMVVNMLQTLGGTFCSGLNAKQ
jgi:ABC-type nitrate/sulfonate/bicarbonate transport system permease component